MTQQEAVLFEKVYVPAWLQKCAELGIPIRSQAELEKALETTALVKAAMAQNEQPSLIDSGNALLKQAMGIPEVDPQADAELYKAAGQVLQDKDVFAAALSVGAA